MVKEVIYSGNKYKDTPLASYLSRLSIGYINEKRLNTIT